jgi:hypothetical protein
MKLISAIVEKEIITKKVFLRGEVREEEERKVPE